MLPPPPRGGAVAAVVGRRGGHHPGPRVRLANGRGNTSSRDAYRSNLNSQRARRSPHRGGDGKWLGRGRGRGGARRGLRPRALSRPTRPRSWSIPPPPAPTSRSPVSSPSPSTWRNWLRTKKSPAAAKKRLLAKAPGGLLASPFLRRFRHPSIHRLPATVQEEHWAINVDALATRIFHHVCAWFGLGVFGYTQLKISC
ncbi:hypothetical protein BS78_04G272200 [Paspalum vaginatum]|nr:hypothetical protein BS78_04G272200 [Paspalum vaginatum]